MEQKFVLAIDQSTAGTKVLLIDQDGQVIVSRLKEHTQYYPQAGFVEHDPLEIYENVKYLMRHVVYDAGISCRHIATISITNQRETALIWDAATGLPLHRAIVWQCRRTIDMCEELKNKGYESLITSKTGLVIDPYFSATKWRWLLDYAKLHNIKGNWMLGTIDIWLIWKLTGGAVHATDYTNASRTLLFNIHTLNWDPELIQLFGLDGVALPELKPSDDRFGYLADESIFSKVGKIPICGVMGDSQAALFAQRCVEPGMAKATYGTGSSVLMNIGPKPVKSGNGLVTALAWKLKDQVCYALEGIIHTTGDCLKWARDNMKLFEDFEELERLTESVEDPDGVYVVPAHVGLGAPYWDPNTRASIVGMNRSTTRAHVLRACIESIAYQIRDVVDVMAHESGISLHELKADGGATSNRILMQFQADMLGRKVITSKIEELSAFGAAYAGGLGVGIWTKNDLDRIYKVGTHYAPHLQETQRERRYDGWIKSVQSVLDYSKNSYSRRSVGAKNETIEIG